MLVKSAPLLYGLSIILSMSVFVNLLTPAGRDKYYIDFHIPGLFNINGEIFFLVFLTLCILSGAVGCYLKWRHLKVILFFGWGLLAIGLRIWEFAWLPVIHFGFPVSFGFFGSFLYLKFNLLPMFLFIWSFSLFLKTKYG
jgi:hypothetical protein